MGGSGAPDDRLGHLTQEWLATSDAADARTSGAPGATAAVAGRPRRAARRPAVLRAHRPDRGAAAVARRGARANAPHGRACRRFTALRTPPAPTRPRREMARERVPLIVIQRRLEHTQPGHHLDLPAGHRQCRDHRHRPRPPSAGGARRQHAAALITRRPAVVVRSDGGRGVDSFRGVGMARVSGSSPGPAAPAGRPPRRRAQGRRRARRRR